MADREQGLKVGLEFLNMPIYVMILIFIIIVVGGGVVVRINRELILKNVHANVVDIQFIDGPLI